MNPKKILIALAVGLVCCLASLLYVHDTTSSSAITYGCMAEESYCRDLYDSQKSSARGFPIYIISTEYAGTAKEKSHINWIEAVLVWLFYTVITLIVLLPWRRIVKGVFSRKPLAQRSIAERVPVALLVGLAVSLLSLLYVRTDIAYQTATCHSMTCAAVMEEYTVSARGFPLESVVTWQAGINGKAAPEIRGIFAVGNWLIYSIISFVALLFWRPKTKKTQNTPRR